MNDDVIAVESNIYIRTSTPDEKHFIDATYGFSFSFCAVAAALPGTLALKHIPPKHGAVSIFCRTSFPLLLRQRRIFRLEIGAIEQQVSDPPSATQLHFLGLILFVLFFGLFLSRAAIFKTAWVIVDVLFMYFQIAQPPQHRYFKLNVPLNRSFSKLCGRNQTSWCLNLSSRPSSLHCQI